MLIDGPRPTAYPLRADDIEPGEVFFADPAETIHGAGPYLATQPITGTDRVACTSLADAKSFAFPPDLPVAVVGARLVVV